MGWLSKIKDKFVDDIIPNEVKDAGETLRKLIPNELGDLAVKAAPFVGMIPGQQGTAALMRGIGRYDQRGDFGDALKQGALTGLAGYGAGKLTSKIPGIQGDYSGIKGIMDFSGDAYNAAKTGLSGGKNQATELLEKIKGGGEANNSSMYESIKDKAKEYGVAEYFLGEDGKFQMSDISNFLKDPGKTIPATMLATYIKEKFFPGETQPDPYNVAMGKRGDDVGSYLRQYGEFDPTRNPNSDPFSDAEKDQFVSDNIVEYQNLPTYAMGGRVNYGLGSLVSSYTANPTGGGNGKIDPQAILNIFKAKFSGNDFTAVPESMPEEDISQENIMEILKSSGPMGSMGSMGSGEENIMEILRSKMPGSASGLSGLRGMLPNLVGKTLRQMNFDSEEEEREEAAYGGRMGYANGGAGYSFGYKPGKEFQLNVGSMGKGTIKEIINSGELTSEDLKAAMDALKDRKAEGGRMGYYDGSDPYDVNSIFKRYERKLLEDKGYDPANPTKYGKDVDSGIRTLQDILNVLFKDSYAKGGRVNYAFGTNPGVVDQASNIEGLDININPQGIKELDLRETGGFIPPVGVKEKADDIPAMLSNNEFVMTADAVREAGDGDVDKGAERMYSMMKNLENGGRV